MSSNFIKLSVEQIKNIRDKGFCYVEVSPFNFVRYTKHDIYINKKDADKILKGEPKDG